MWRPLGCGGPWGNCPVLIPASGNFEPQMFSTTPIYIWPRAATDSGRDTHTHTVAKDEVVSCRARTSHTHLTHSYILKKDPPPQCEHCQCILTVRHILVECNHFAEKRNYIFRFHPALILFYLNECQFYDKF